MKKLKLKALELGAREVLTREQLKNVLGGFDDGSGSGSGTSCSTKCVVDGNKIYSCIYSAAVSACICPVIGVTAPCS